jgi:hypothetical protein
MRVRRAAWGGLAAFVAIVGAEHLLDRSLDPATHEISEYVHGSAGGLMVAGVCAWAISLAATAALATASQRMRPTSIPLWTAAVGLMVTASFATQASAGHLPPGVRLGTSGRLHDLGSGATSLGLFVAAATSIFVARGAKRYRRVTTTLLALAVASDLGLLAIGPAVGGLRQRLLVAAGCLWQITFLHQLDTAGDN